MNMTWSKTTDYELRDIYGTRLLENFSLLERDIYGTRLLKFTLVRDSEEIEDRAKIFAEPFFGRSWNNKIEPYNHLKY